MSEEPETLLSTETHSRPLTKWEQHRFLVMVAGIIAIALFLVGVSMALYSSSGTAQLDLSRPGYVTVRERAGRSESFDEFSSTGAINQQTVEEFRKLYAEQSDKATKIDSFGGNVMTDQSLAIDDAPPINE